MATPADRHASLDPWELCDGLPGIVCVAGSHGEIVYANREWREAFGGSGALSIEDVAAAIHPDDLEEARRAWAAASRAGEPYEIAERLRDRTGTFRWYHIRSRPVATADGVLLYVGVLTDIDEEKRYARYLKFLGDASDIFARETDVNVAMRRVADGVVPMAADWVIVYLPDGEGGYVAKSIVHRDPARIALFEKLLSTTVPSHYKLMPRALATGEPQMLTEITPETLREMAATAEQFELFRQLDPRSILVVPIVGREETWGALQFTNDWSTPRLLGDADVRLGQELAKQTAAALDNAVLLTAAARAADELRFLAEVGETMVESLDLGSRLDRFVNAVVPRLADWATVNLLRDDGSVETVAIAHRDPAKRKVVERLRGPYYGTLDSDQGTPVALRTGRPRLLSGVDERFLRKHIRPETFDDVIELGADSSFTVPLSAQGEIYGTLAAMRTERERPFGESDMWLIQELARRAAVAIANARLFERSATVANAFQEASLPASLPTVDGATFSAFYAPGGSEAMVGGDWYDAFRIGDGRLVVSIGDVSGSGLSAAVVMGSVRQLIRGAVQLLPDARVILDATDRAMRTEYPDTIVTAFVAIVDLEGRTVAYASAGHPPPFLCRADSIAALDVVGLPLGLRTIGEASETVVTFEPGDTLVLYTDGLTESTRDILAGERSVRAALAGDAFRRGENPARELHDAVLPDGAADDVAILVVRLTANP